MLLPNFAQKHYASSLLQPPIAHYSIKLETHASISTAMVLLLQSLLLQQHTNAITNTSQNGCLIIAHSLLDATSEPFTMTQQYHVSTTINPVAC